MSITRKYHNHKPVAPQKRDTFTRHHKDKLINTPSSLFPIKMIAKSEWTQSNAQHNKEQLQNPTIGETINKESTTKEPQPSNGQQPKLLRAKIYFTGTKS